MDRIARRYRGRWLQGYVRGKLRADPIYEAAFQVLKDEPLPVLDLGCGIGLFEAYLRERGYAAPLLGVDFDPKKIAQAQRIAVLWEEVRFEMFDASEHNLRLPAPKGSGHVVLFDLLHYLDAAAQRALLARAAAHVASGALCLVRVTLRDGSWRFRVTQVEEFFLRASRWMKSGAAHYPTAEEVLAPFEARGFACTVRPMWGRTPFNSHLFILRAPPDQR